MKNISCKHLIILLLSLLYFTNCEDQPKSALNINLNPPEENSKDTIGIPFK
jgi:hypothetical protein